MTPSLKDLKEAVQAIKDNHYSDDRYRQGVFKLLSLAEHCVEHGLGLSESEINKICKDNVSLFLINSDLPIGFILPYPLMQEYEFKAIARALCKEQKEKMK